MRWIGTIVWERVSLAYNAMVLGEGLKIKTGIEAVTGSYERQESDEFIKPTIIVDGEDKSITSIKQNDSIIFYNFRPDRAREITRAFVDPEFNGFIRKNGYFEVYFVCLTQYDESMPKVAVAFKPESLKNTFGEYISRFGLKQLRIAETEKYAHVTFFFNGGVEKVYDGEDRVLIPSPKVATYDMKPR